MRIGQGLHPSIPTTEFEHGRAVALRLGEQLSRDARTRVIAACAVVLVHSSYPPGHAAVSSAAAPIVQNALSATFTLMVAFPVNTFILLSFLGVASRLEAGLAGTELVRAAAARLVPAHLFWAVAFLGARSLATHDVPSPRAVLEGIVLGQAAAHLYFTPQLLALMAASPVLERLARTPAVALASGAAMAFASITLDTVLGLRGTWLHAGVGFLGLAPSALAGLALGRWWSGIAPGAARARQAVRLAVPIVGVSAVVLVRAASRAHGSALALTPATWLANNGLALAVPVLLLSIRSSVPPRVIRLAPFTLGVYLIHPFFVQALRVVEGRVHQLAAMPSALILPNAAMALVLSFIAVMLIAGSPLRRIVI